MEVIMLDGVAIKEASEWFNEYHGGLTIAQGRAIIENHYNIDLEFDDTDKVLNQVKTPLLIQLNTRPHDARLRTLTLESEGFAPRVTAFEKPKALPIIENEYQVRLYRIKTWKELENGPDNQSMGHFIFFEWWVFTEEI